MIVPGRKVYNNNWAGCVYGESVIWFSPGRSYGKLWRRD